MIVALIGFHMIATIAELFFSDHMETRLKMCQEITGEYNKDLISKTGRKQPAIQQQTT